MNIKINTRVEKDLLGHKEIPAHCYYGVQTLRALENFNLSPNKLNQFPVFIFIEILVRLVLSFIVIFLCLLTCNI